MSDLTDYDSTADTLRHATRVAELLAPILSDLAHRGAVHDRSKTEEPERPVFDEYTPKLAGSTYGSPEYLGFLGGMLRGLDHREMADHYGIDPDEYTIDGETDTGELTELLRQAAEEAILSIDQETVVSVVFGTGGPHTEWSITISDGEPIRGEAVGYWGGDKVTRRLSDDEVNAITNWLQLTDQ